MTKVTPFHTSHIGALLPRWDVVNKLRECTPEYFGALAAEPAITIWCAGAPVACVGVLGGVEVWGVFDEQRARQHPHAVAREVKRFLSTFTYLYADCAVPIDTRLPRWLGFDDRQGVKAGCIHLERIA